MELFLELVDGLSAQLLKRVDANALKVFGVVHLTEINYSHLVVNQLEQESALGVRCMSRELVHQVGDKKAVEGLGLVVLQVELACEC